MTNDRASVLIAASEVRRAADLANHFNISRETIEKYQIYGEKIELWQRGLNLVARRSLSEMWHRHFVDSLQLQSFIPEKIASYADFGSGGGFPGLVLAIALCETTQTVKTHLVESDQRKAAFLREVARATEIPIEIQSTRIEADATKIAIGPVDFISARALAPLDRLFPLIHPYCHASTVSVLPKGKAIESELAAARQQWSFDLEVHPSRTDPDGRIAIVRDLRPSV
ncbi:MAG: 16S rRNA (guanine(527)-N(7))-methyltransferase RsmG [Pseudomonadota bacterium]